MSWGVKQGGGLLGITPGTCMSTDTHMDRRIDLGPNWHTHSSAYSPPPALPREWHTHVHTQVSRLLPKTDTVTQTHSSPRFSLPSCCFLFSL